jgi:predicted unusual protein kinase regulating ubiquinone biosynthesis (AarF/ABC1/UbiB family)
VQEGGQWVAVKVQRPDVLSTVSKDLYVLRRAAEVYQVAILRTYSDVKICN